MVTLRAGGVNVMKVGLRGFDGPLFHVKRRALRSPGSQHARARESLFGKDGLLDVHLVMVGLRRPPPLRKWLRIGRSLARMKGRH